MINVTKILAEPNFVPKYQNEISKLKEFFTSAKAYLKGSKEKTNLAYDAMQNV